jgi:hypothetical protein
MRAADAEPAVVLLGGKAGVGKTRLGAELTSHCTANGTRVLVGGCVPVGGDGLPYAPIVEALRALHDEMRMRRAQEPGLIDRHENPPRRVLVRKGCAMGCP